MAQLVDTIAALRSRNESAPLPLRLPTVTDVDAAERQLGIAFHSDYRRYLLEASDVVVGTVEPLVLMAPDSHIDLLSTVRNAWEFGVPRDLLPICGDNGNWFCMRSDGAIVYWDHNGANQEEWCDLSAWIQDVWLGDLQRRT